MKLSINKVRGKLYQSAKILGDVQALTHKNQKKAIPKRIARRIAGKQTAGSLVCCSVNGEGARMMYIFDLLVKIAKETSLILVVWANLSLLVVWGVMLAVLIDLGYF